MEFQIAPYDIRLLESSFTRKGITYAERGSGDTFRVYGARLDSEGREWFEVFQRRINAPHEIQGNKIPASEAFPSDSAFGSWAFTFPNLEQAIEKGKGFTLHKSVSA